MVQELVGKTYFLALEARYGSEGDTPVQIVEREFAHDHRLPAPLAALMTFTTCLFDVQLPGGG